MRETMTDAPRGFAGAWPRWAGALLCLFVAAAVCPGAGRAGDEPLPPRVAPQPAEVFTAKFVKVAFAAAPLPKNMEPGLLTAGLQAAYNSMTIGWYSFGVLWGKPVANVYVHPDRFTFRYMEKEPLFTVSFYDEGPAARKALMEVFGRKSGRDCDKEKESGFTPALTPSGAVTYLEARCVLVCRRMAKVSFDDPAFQALPPIRKTKHTQYTAEVLEVWVRK